MNTIAYRNLTFTHADLTEGDGNTWHALAGESLAADSLDFRVYCPSDPELDFRIVTADGYNLVSSDSYILKCLVPTPLTEFVPGDVVTHFSDDSLVKKFYLDRVRRAGKGLYEFENLSAIGILDKSYHFGGMYAGIPVTTVLAEILDGLDYEIDPIVNSIKLYGWLPYAPKRKNLRAITVAHALAIRTKSDGALSVTALSSEIKSVIGKSRAVVGGEVATETPYTAVQVDEHYWQEDTEGIVLCNETFMTRETILFREPVHSLSITGGTIVESNANYAIIQGSGAVNLTGKRYIHTIKRITEGTISGNASDNVYTLNDSTVITSLNSSKVAKKLYEAFSRSQTIKQDILHENERPGDVVSVINPYTEAMESACIKKLSSKFGNLRKASGEFLVGYAPSGVITGYQHCAVITADSTFTVPAGVTEIRTIEISGGKGGQGGFPGANGTNGSRLPEGWQSHGSNDFVTEAYNGEGGAGGEPGAAGEGGRVLDTGALTVTPGQSFAVHIGEGGLGGNVNGGLGADGEDTTFGAYSTSAGIPISNGYVDILTGNVYGISGLAGLKGAKGRGKTNFAESGVYGFPAWAGVPTMAFSNGWASTSYWYSFLGKYLYGMSGSGGGCAYFSDGSHGISGSADYNNGHGFAQGGVGGLGATPTNSFNATVFGGGGHGGHGGGGGGGGGSWLNPVGGSSYEWYGAGGLGGNGSKGGNGKKGIVLVYY